jgi:Family of unknown function (DUF6325)
MSDTDNAALDELGPIDYIIVEYPADREPDGSALPILLDLVDSGTIRILDLAFLRRELDGGIVALDISDAGLTGDFDVTVFAGAASGLIGEDDINEAGTALEPGCTAALLVYENTWAAPFARALRRNGAQLVAYGHVPVQALLAAAEALDS